MSETHAPFEEPHEPGLTEIRLRGHLDARWADWFEGMRMRRERDGTTTLSGPVVDQAALHGLLKKVRDLGLPLLSVMQVEPKAADGPPGSAEIPPNRPHKETDA